MTTWNFVCLGLGSNLGNRHEYIKRAYESLKKAGIRNLKSSVILETKALLLEGSPKEWDLPYFNCVAIGETQLSPDELVKEIKMIENRLSRDSSLKWGPRSIDIDVLLYGDESYSCCSERCIIPHPRLLERPFLLSMMASLCPYRYFRLRGSPYDGKTFAELAAIYPLTEKDVLGSFAPTTQIMGIVNVTDDSISDTGLFLEAKRAAAHAERLFAEGASIIDLGAQATNPRVRDLGSVEQEWERLEPVLQILAESWKDAKQYPDVSIDTFRPEVIRRAIQVFPIRWINDVSGGSLEMAHLAKDLGLRLLINHSCSLPPRPDCVLSYEESPVTQMLRWGESQLETFAQIGLDTSWQVVFDPGIGFGKTPVQSMQLMEGVAKFKHILKCPVLIGHSRKSCLSLLGRFSSQDRDWETIGCSVALHNQGVDYLRVHQVEGNRRVLAAAAWSGMPV
ncbi:bifunctional 2-amino-4-hydroxy-6-hydroxymethyldihydropteridine diphosphokinase/dihydropteroate synthase [Chlamydia muridarum str. Nigg]|uniref:Folate synthesis bifunctional protein n=2 Tax=Chlamydia muridarum TaxID=83560 RepID=FOLKP_CHLMU|nr:dihydropteroate synthase [Chlamydia muridarum]P82602.1 RecName: Full=Folate synthesis bifunctional protein; Includes: RecName: Full=6-hydroxymethyl-7,8-dihydropterin pyrophosphokinase; Short=HPPK; AltName: Full=2-amino-4-hydroxy-6-hydroxymethyldihydropteridine pyrophosphokinase; AltName: Full=7,8-dihydro-6-hydroxymethylpterin-pyrophosphokinase; Short=PPPK; Includes: RecName: Full=Dihydropteroate synthase; Short=DHPS; AltName: Full=Dihydropteroate pyrophosphorylase [Chlamydia muridarum str. Nigg